MEGALEWWLAAAPHLLSRNGVERGLLAGTTGLSLMWGGMLMSVLWHAPAPGRLLVTWLRTWAVPALFLAIGVCLMCVGDDLLGRALGSGVGIIHRLIPDWRDSRVDLASSPPEVWQVALSPGAACTRDDLVVSGCPR